MEISCRSFVQGVSKGTISATPLCDCSLVHILTSVYHAVNVPVDKVKARLEQLSQFDDGEDGENEMLQLT